MVSLGKSNRINKDWLRERVRMLREESIFENPYKVRFKEVKRPEEMSGLIESNLETLMLNVTDECNFRCRYCSYSGIYEDQRCHGKRHMSKDIALKATGFFLNRVSRTEDLLITFFGGEPLLNFDVIKAVVEFARKNEKVEFSITTNGSLMDKNIFLFLREHDFHIYVSVDGPAEQHDLWRVYANGGKTWSNIEKTLQFIYKSDPAFYKRNVHFQATVTPPYDYVRLNDYFLEHKYFKDNFVRLNNLNLDGIESSFEQQRKQSQINMNSCNSLVRDRIVSEEFDSVKLLLNRLYPHFRSIYLRDRIDGTNRVFCNGICVPCIRKIFVSTNGGFYVCEKMDHYQDIGNVNEGVNIDSVVALLNDYYADVVSTCSDCWMRNFCRMCFVDCVENNTLSFSKKRRLCAGNRKLFKSIMEMYLEIDELNPKAMDKLMEVYSESYD